MDVVVVPCAAHERRRVGIVAGGVEQDEFLDECSCGPQDPGVERLGFEVSGDFGGCVLGE